MVLADVATLTRMTNGQVATEFGARSAVGLIPMLGPLPRMNETFSRLRPFLLRLDPLLYLAAKDAVNQNAA